LPHSPIIADERWLNGDAGVSAAAGASFVDPDELKVRDGSGKVVIDEFGDKFARRVFEIERVV
jgi:hypothetical protein